MRRPLPPLNALRAFDAAARHLSFTNAAGELGVTPAAISHQIKALEDYLGVRLFRRLQRSLLLTETGQLLAPGLARGFRELQAAVDDVMDQDEAGPLTVSAAPSFASMWLVPRLERFSRQYPDIDVRLDASTSLVDFSRDDVDISIRYGAGDYPGLMVECLLEHCVTPVCAPSLLEAHPLEEPGDLRHHTLLHVDWRAMDDGMPNWGMWLAVVGAKEVDHERGPRFNDSSLAVQAAMAGHGVALINEALVEDHLADGRLVKPFEQGVSGPGGFNFYLVGPERTWRKPKIKAFREWLMEEAEHTGKRGAPC
ncbi:MAG: transcriptional regulator GcvA [Rhodovibrionaceae bacterium]|nr:transcriptional regulator GcvA [Rhodovibrionaceae bacterium]